MRAVAISGKSGSGRSTAARLLLEELRALEIDVLQVSKADALKAEVKQLYEIDERARDWASKLREQQELRQREEPDYWLKRLCEQLERLDRSGVVGLVPEIDRRPEADLLRELGVLLVRVDAKRTVRVQRLAARGLNPQLALSKEPIESELDDYEFDAVLRNSSSLAHLRRQVHKLATRLL
jgi:dephospho-CoA kinase